MKEKRKVITSVLGHLQNMDNLGASEVGAQDKWQLAELGFSAVNGNRSQVEQIIDNVCSYVWSRPDIEVISTERDWWDGLASS